MPRSELIEGRMVYVVLIACSVLVGLTRRRLVGVVGNGTASRDPSEGGRQTKDGDATAHHCANEKSAVNAATVTRACVPDTGDVACAAAVPIHEPPAAAGREHSRQPKHQHGDTQWPQPHHLPRSSFESTIARPPPQQAHRHVQHPPQVTTHRNAVLARRLPVDRRSFFIRDMRPESPDRTDEIRSNRSDLGGFRPGCE